MEPAIFMNPMYGAKKNAERQAAMLARAAEYLRPGERLLMAGDFGLDEEQAPGKFRSVGANGAWLTTDRLICTSNNRRVTQFDLSEVVSFKRASSFTSMIEVETKAAGRFRLFIGSERRLKEILELLSSHAFPGIEVTLNSPGGSGSSDQSGSATRADDGSKAGLWIVGGLLVLILLVLNQCVGDDADGNGGGGDCRSTSVGVPGTNTDMVYTECGSPDAPTGYIAPNPSP